MQALVAGVILKDIISKERKIFPPKQKRLKGLQALMTKMSPKPLFTVCTKFSRYLKELRYSAQCSIRSRLNASVVVCHLTLA
jgi:hypothetical protein